ncbi:MAG: hypothetical protein IM504_19845 [Microcystis sp. M038S2]|jgi:hypothetical protein|uniref:hypothetical protein n=1 Tax=unclassified Microcystis TaxID=2643300 RepID=UPI00119040DA|nr:MULTISPECIES: hypothetical protein [unclassified Microcystis]MCU7242766.1 hypothetical protein [Microcystis aeruginosa WS75]NCS40369.1 hypothetical protein [Microcystis aeruginosa BS13-10]TRU57284.1 MAG: hypothetical protein EWV48_18845 [Microcystis aeruginosa Ma_QC_C_20070823_S13]TRU58484.1 MAG: hypothetical protein EWV56_14440 [Microcystis aeruginosa Ma_QC_C_20070823_S13D]MCA2683454.1 hypothetical protein [Microcystis sp. M046S2]
MLMKWLTNWQVSLVAAVLLTNSLVSPVMAQTGNQSDITGPILSTSDFAGQTLPITTTVTVTGFQGGEPAQISVNQAAASVNTQLADNNLTSPTGTPIPPAFQESILSILTGDAQAGNNINAVTAALYTAPGAPPLNVIEDLLASLERLTKDEKVVPAKLLAAVQAYNVMILASNEEFLRNPPAELRAIQASLAKLVEATIS